MQLNEALSAGAHGDEAAVPDARATVDYQEARGPGDETWAHT